MSENGIATRARALVIGPYLSERTRGTFDERGGAAALRSARGPEARLAEARGLAEAIDLDIVDAQIVLLRQIHPASFLGKGKVAELAEFARAEEIDLVIMDCALSPVQQRNLEKALSAKVIDRTGLILEIFGLRARTREGALQVELAHLAYQKSRLVRSWTHLERQRGGFGFLGGPGETQIETDRRLIQERMSRIEQELAGVKRTRGLHRKTRRATPYPIIALVGYTNAGKSTLFNRLTKAGVLAEDMLFATLDPTLRGVCLPHGGEIILSDTVGFISELPTMLVSAFRATLEEVLEADVILHVRDVAHEDSEPQRSDVEAVLADLGVDPSGDRRLMEVWNKADLLDDDRLAASRADARSRSAGAKPIIVSALTGQGVDELYAAIEARLAIGRVVFEVPLDPVDGRSLNWLYEHTEVLRKRTESDGSLSITIRVALERAEMVRRRFIVDAPVQA
ncbi:GTPase HflX [Methylocapsa acidiphila]|uniref:GTPase HflX n=1 Tax=Methylocapsa acidiphila TaxID=133552 RepID=UPI00047E7B3D|nr:GTPase HflX [Methylocapsa acidiphila]